MHCGGTQTRVGDKVDGRKTGTNGRAKADERVLVVDDDGLLADGLAALARGFGMDARRTAPADLADVAGSYQPTVVVVCTEQVQLEESVTTAQFGAGTPPRILWLDVRADARDGRSPTSKARPRITTDLDPARFTALLVGDAHEARAGAADARAVRPATSTHGEGLIGGLTLRERSVLEELASGRTNGAIAERLNVSPNTIRTHVQNIFHKLNVGSRLEAVALAAGTGLLAADADARA